MPPPRALRTHAFEVQDDGAPLVAREREVAAPAAGQLTVRVRASSLNARDLPITTGRYSRPVPPGRVPLSDGAGVVEAVGDGVTRFRTGDRVLSSFHPNWIYGPLPGWNNLYGLQLDGWLTERITVSEQNVVAVPDHLSFEEAATLPCAALTAWSALAGTGAGHTVLLQGSGGVSVFALQFARLFGAQVIVTTSSAEKGARLRELGASTVLDRTRFPDWGKRVRELTDDRGVDLVVEIGGAGTIAQSLTALAYGGRISLVGNLASGEGMDLTRFLQRGATLRTITVGNREDLEQLARTIGLHRLRPVIDRVFPFEQAPLALEYFARRSRVGKVVISH
ncbi:zinc-dependent alcohol dehydrogenase family protein [Amycolatopsis jiangsuensis]|uniref:NADPH:quinone reductase-like Zn-dependent oxidoreductase n=1 Tax=Amycolatopsis jiangsuensis TaxID=1181879 RepID=A0A840ISU8_9PSEU|nr:NAD(P)-dependent alcohol dehydrogenase [Amycolatopsis jiangsuensis]MBB4684282.1 NADPH:quinone reductase-like Zn-dependent oxidoreductase [Amycolatopsis jiangsuensis]